MLDEKDEVIQVLRTQVSLSANNIEFKRKSPEE
jgi:hypothetical protein